MATGVVLFFFFFSGIRDTALAEERRVDVYGYAQVDYQGSSQPGVPQGFQMRRLNLITEAPPTNRVRVLGDIELEEGANIAPARIEGTVKISRAFIEYLVAPELKFKAGKILTPFGLYNEVHDFSATYFPIDVPQIYNLHGLYPGVSPQRFYSKYSTGLEASGVFNMGHEGTQLEYHLLASNGRSETPEGFNATQSPGIGARVVYRPSVVPHGQFGLSFYSDVNAVGIGGITYDRESTLAFDFQYETSSLQLQAESWFAGYRSPDFRNEIAWLSYIQLAYTFFDRLTPYVQYAYERYDLNEPSNNQGTTRLGLDFAITPTFFAKSEVQLYGDELGPPDVRYSTFRASLAVAF